VIAIAFAFALAFAFPFAGAIMDRAGWPRAKPARGSRR
jgi:hypothetical protein